MVNIIIELSKYIIIFLMTAYTFSCFSIFVQEYEESERHILIRQNILMFLIHFMAYMVMYLKTGEQKLIVFYGCQVVYFIAVIVLYRIIYPNVSSLIVNNMCMLISIGLIMITRLEFADAVKQFIYAIVGAVIGLVVPVIIRKMKTLIDWTYIYAGVGFAFLCLVAVFAATSGGAKLGFTIAGFGVQPSEFVKILFVFFVAASLQKSTDFKNVLITTAIAAAHVLILVLSTDLGAALIFFVVYLVMLYVATRQPLYAIAGIGAGSVAAMLGYLSCMGSRAYEAYADGRDSECRKALQDSKAFLEAHVLTWVNALAQKVIEQDARGLYAAFAQGIVMVAHVDSVQLDWLMGYIGE